MGNRPDTQQLQQFQQKCLRQEHIFTKQTDKKRKKIEDDSSPKEEVTIYLYSDTKIQMMGVGVGGPHEEILK